MVILAVLGSYLLGSIPSAYIAGRLSRGIDIREFGDGNSGATNAARVMGRSVGLAVFAVDLSKGVLAILLAQCFVQEPVVILAGIAVVAGHNWPVYIGFRGGMGHSTTIGVLCVLLPLAMGILLIASAIPYFVMRKVKLAGAIQFGPLWLVALLMGAPVVLVGYSVGLPCLIGIRHLQTSRRRRMLLSRESTACDEGSHQGA